MINTRAAIVFVSIIAASVAAARRPIARPLPRPMPAEVAPGQEDPAMKMTAWEEADVVLVGKLEEVIPGPVAQSMPPIYHNTLVFKVEQVLRGEVKVGDTVRASHMARQVDAPAFDKGESYVVAGGTAREGWIARFVLPASKENISEATAATTLPLGWAMIDDKPVSPWASLGEKAWPKDQKAPGETPICSKTGRPALMAGKGVKLEVEAVPPKVEKKWQNPDGDGLYKITVSNTTDKPLAVAALLTVDGKILWAESLVVVCQGKAYSCPGARGISGKPEPTTIPPGQSVSTTINALGLEGPDWPRGGSRVEFKFALGEKAVSKSFYYFSALHDAMRKAPAQPPLD